MSVTDPQATKVAEAKLLFTYLYIYIFIYVPARFILAKELFAGIVKICC
jgi:hypothetical protein